MFFWQVIRIFTFSFTETLIRFRPIGVVPLIVPSLEKKAYIIGIQPKQVAAINSATYNNCKRGSHRVFCSHKTLCYTILRGSSLLETKHESARPGRSRSLKESLWNGTYTLTGMDGHGLSV